MSDLPPRTPITRENPLVVFRDDIETRAPQFKAVLPSHITFEKFQRVALTAAQLHPEILTYERRSLITTLIEAATTLFQLACNKR